MTSFLKTTVFNNGIFYFFPLFFLCQQVLADKYVSENKCFTQFILFTQYIYIRINKKIAPQDLSEKYPTI